MAILYRSQGDANPLHEPCRIECYFAFSIVPTQLSAGLCGSRTFLAMTWLGSRMAELQGATRSGHAIGLSSRRRMVNERPRGDRLCAGDI